MACQNPYAHQQNQSALAITRDKSRLKHPTIAEDPVLLAQWDHSCNAEQGHLPDKIRLKSNSLVPWRSNPQRSRPSTLSAAASLLDHMNGRFHLLGGCLQRTARQRSVRLQLKNHTGQVSMQWEKVEKAGQLLLKA